MADLEDRFGKPWDEMDDGQFKMAVHDVLFEITIRLDKINGSILDTTGSVIQHRIYFKAIWWIIGIITIGLIGLLFDMFKRGIFSG